MLIYTKVKDHVEAINKVEKLAGGLPVAYEMNFSMMYLGEIGDMMEIQLKASKKEMGWLYSKTSLILFKTQGCLFEMWLSDLKTIAEEAFKAKQFSDMPKHGSLMKNKETGAIAGYLNTYIITSKTKPIA